MEKKADLMILTDSDWLAAAKALYERGELSEENYLKIKKALGDVDARKEFEVKWIGG
jgi:hypothetical protein